MGFWTEKSIQKSVFFDVLVKNQRFTTFPGFVKYGILPEDPGGIEPGLLIFPVLLMTVRKPSLRGSARYVNYGLYPKKPGEPWITAQTRGSGSTDAMCTAGSGGWYPGSGGAVTWCDP